ncbi:two-component system, chemotaxis family, sensor kinase CheA [Pelagirhabdus alkalitolerans]|uniref:Chemotaxis protein CheA n=1 Tax=Pelagirhabdus alkalitolerans TaxID=1612202 RepID=A0A1G6H3Y6_9BACI|nr:chemotaxis protein CheA [Pelagirhabdus alkalitolerans]SDB88874.1 two-component system, chemotaxis family, sensor kinase CheA [Pelagirhabdus alkalitolerans]
MEMNEYLDVFIEESKEHIQSLNDQILELEKDPTNIDIVNEIFRSAHTLKGMSATMGFQDLADLTHKLENVLDGVRNDKLTLNTEIIDVIFNAVDDLEAMVLDIIEGGEGKKDVSKLVNQLQAIENGDFKNDSSIEGQKTEQPEQKVTQATKSETQLDQFELTVLEQSKESGFNNYEITVELQESTLLKAARVYMVFEILEQVGEVIKSTPTVTELEDENFDYEFTVILVSKEDNDAIQQKIMKVSEIEKVTVLDFAIENQQTETSQETKKSSEEAAEQSSTAPAEKSNSDQNKESSKGQMASKTIRVNIDRLDALMNLFEELVIDRGRLEQISSSLRNNELQETVEHMTRISGDLQNIILNMRMVPIDQVFNRFPRMVRQLAKDLNKKIDLQVYGAETELDRTVIDEIGDPLVHLIRNALDHGIEMPEERVKKGKPEEGVLKLNAYHSGNHVFIEISDNGAGIDRDKVIEKAIKNNVITREQAASYSDQQVYQLIMESGFSTADQISDISGRGVGLDVVKNTIESLGGNITIQSTLNEGSMFSIQLPLTLSIISVMLTEVENEKYAIPLSSIIETAIVHKKDIMRAHNKQVIDFRGKVVPLVSLKNVFSVPGDREEDDYYSVVIIRQGDKMAGLIVDTFIGQQEVVLKSLGNYLSDIFAISGATILGDGQVALIVDTNALIK